MKFEETLEYHLSALTSRNLDAFLSTVCKDNITLIMPNGMILKTYEQFKQFHKDWFMDMDWKMTYTVMNINITSEMASALLSVKYSDLDQDGNVYKMTYYLNLIFECFDGRWLLIVDQNTLFSELN